MELLPECRLTLRSKWKWCTLLQHRLTHAWCQPGCFLTFDYTYAGSLDFHFEGEKDLAGIKREPGRKSLPYAAEHPHFSKQPGNRDCKREKNERMDGGVEKGGMVVAKLLRKWGKQHWWSQYEWGELVCDRIRGNMQDFLPPLPLIKSSYTDTGNASWPEGKH